MPERIGLPGGERAAALAEQVAQQPQAERVRVDHCAVVCAALVRHRPRAQCELQSTCGSMQYESSQYCTRAVLYCTAFSYELNTLEVNTRMNTLINKLFDGRACCVVLLVPPAREERCFHLSKASRRIPLQSLHYRRNNVLHSGVLDVIADCAHRGAKKCRALRTRFVQRQRQRHWSSGAPP